MSCLIVLYKKGCLIVMLCYEEINSRFGQYPTFNDMSESDQDAFLKDSRLDNFIEKISGFSFITESRFVESFYETGLKLNPVEVLEWLPQLDQFKLYSIDKFNGEKTYVNMKLVH